MAVRDYNGVGKWSEDSVASRYAIYAQQQAILPLRDIRSERSGDAENGWIYPVMESVIAGIEAGDAACAQIGVEFIEQDQGFTFGAILKSNTARALRRFPGLPEPLVARIRERVTAMLSTGTVPREFRQYAKLLRRIGVGDHWARIDAVVPQNRLAARSLAYILEHCERDLPS